jgi:leucyl-tRNA synthetase
MDAFLSLQEKWQKKWEKDQIFKAKEGKKKKYYVLEMYPYPSASFLHMGHVRNYTIGDVYARFKRMQGFNVLYPMGYDSFGLPAETAAKKEGIHPLDYTKKSIAKIMEYQKALGNSYDWDRTLASHDPEFYRWNQYFFLLLYKKGLAYRKKAPVNWCPSCESVLANEEAEHGRCWRCDTEVIKKDLEQWFFKITAYADRLLEDMNKIDWTESIKTLQRNWIGKSFGTEIAFEINGKKWPVFTTRPDTIYGVTFTVIAAQHPYLMDIVTQEQKHAVENFVRKCQKVKTQEDIESLDKEGVFTGAYAINPLTHEKVPVWAGNFVVADYGSGMVMAVPAHDQRDFEFAEKYHIPIRQVIAPSIVVSGICSPRENVETLVRKTVTAIIEHSNGHLFLLLKEPESFLLVGGGIENGETPEQAIIREVREETGYVNMDIKRILAKELHAFGYRISKNKNQKSTDTVFYIKLKDEQQIKSEANQGKHELVWMEKKDVGNRISWEHHKYMWDLFVKDPSAYVDDGILTNSGIFSGMESTKAIDEITKHLTKLSIGKKIVQYKIRDWLISRQRYWGTPIPMVHCDKCGIVPIPEKDLPVLLPKEVDFKISNSLANNPSFVNIKCPKCKGNAKRETDTMGGFMDSSWYFLRYCDNKNKKEPFDKKKVNYWMPVDQYIGGIEHAVGHLLYARFFVKVLYDEKILLFDEPFSKLFNQGVVYKDGVRMSKSKGNVVHQTEISQKYGIDTARFFLMSLAAPDKAIEWRDEGIDGSYKFIKKVFSLTEKPQRKIDPLTETKLHKTIHLVTEGIEKFEYNKSVVTLMEFVNYLQTLEKIPKEALEAVILLISPITPHMAEEMWEKIGKKGYISLAKWPVYDPKKIDEKAEAAETLIQNITKDVRSVMELAKLSSLKNIHLIIAPIWKHTLFTLLKKELEKTRNMKEIMQVCLQEPSLKQYGQEISGVIGMVLKDPSKIPAVLLTQKQELDCIEKAKKTIEEQFLASLILETAEATKESKAKNALPGKPAILLS